MSALDPAGLHLHEQSDLFAEAIRFTAARMGFLPRLIEKDYFCTMLLAHMARADDALVFKGGTCLAKVHASFHRMSEDLDFTISTRSPAGRSERSRSGARLKAAFARISGELPPFRMIQPLTGANESRQNVGTMSYPSLFLGAVETIQVEIGMREPLLTPVHLGQASTALLDPVLKKPLIEKLSVQCLSMREALAEKFRAALTRREAAIRDFYDIDHAVRVLGVRPQEDEFLALLRRKLVVAGTGAPDVTREKLAALWRQVDTNLRPSCARTTSKLSTWSARSRKRRSSRRGWLDEPGRLPAGRVACDIRSGGKGVAGDRVRAHGIGPARFQGPGPPVRLAFHRRSPPRA